MERPARNPEALRQNPRGPVCSTKFITSRKRFSLRLFKDFPLKDCPSLSTENQAVEKKPTTRVVNVKNVFFRDAKLSCFSAKGLHVQGDSTPKKDCVNTR